MPEIIKEIDMSCKKCKDKYHTTAEHKIFKAYFKKSIPELVSIIIALEVENDRLENIKCRQYEDN